jgi:glucokinase-like ROK family protein
MKKATQQQTKEHNRNLALKTIMEHASISRAEIARKTSLTRTTVSDIVAELIAEGLVNEIGVGESLGGKSPILLSLVEDSRCLLSLDLAHNQFTGATVNLRGKIRERLSRPVKVRQVDETLALVYQILDQLLASACQPVVGIGVGTPGLVNTREGVVVNAVNLDWQNLPLRDLLQERYHLPVYVLNDSQAAAMGEYAYGAGHDPDSNLVVINARHGIGAGIVIHGRLFHGDGGYAGEIGHIVVVPEGGLLCRCGNHGCLETVASVQALIRRTQVLDNLPAVHTDTLEAIERAFAGGDALIQQVVLEAGRYLGLAIASLVGTLNIQKIVLTGEMTCFGQPWLKAVQETMRQSSLTRLAQATQLELGKLGGNGVILGASALLANDYSLLFSHRS